MLDYISDILQIIISIVNVLIVLFIFKDNQTHNEKLLRWQFKQDRIRDEIETWQGLIPLLMRFNEYEESRPYYIEYVTKHFGYPIQAKLMPVNNKLDDTSVYAIAINEIAMLKKQLR